MIMNRKKKVTLLLVAMLITMCLCTACVQKKGEKNTSKSEENTKEKVENADEKEDQDVDNPLKIIGMKAEFDGSILKKITLQTPNGDLKYSDEDAELYYDDYALIFTWAKVICDKLSDYYMYKPEYKDRNKIDNIKNGLKDNLLEVVCNLPLDDSYPEEVKEYVNNVYYDYKDAITNTLQFDKRRSGYKQYVFYTDSYKNNPHYVLVKKDNDGILYISPVGIY